MKVSLWIVSAFAIVASSVPSAAQGGGCEPSWQHTFGGVTDVVGTLSVGVVFDDGSGAGARLFVGGGFTRVATDHPSNVVAFDGTSWHSVGTITNGSVSALVVFDDGSGPALYAGGAFLVADGVAVNHVARWDGTSWSAVGGGTDDVVQCFAVFDDGSGAALYAGGLFTTAGGAAASHIARWDGASWSALGSGTNKSVLALAVADDGSGRALYAGGNLTVAGGLAANHVASWDGASWSPLGSGTDDRVLSLREFDDGGGPALYAGGQFLDAGGGAANHVAKWNGASWSPLAGGADGDVYALEVFDDGNGSGLYASGTFARVDGIPTSHVARWNGASWAVLPESSTPHSNRELLAVFDDGSGGGPALYTDNDWRWNGTAWTRVTVAPHILDQLVLALTSFDDGGGPALYAGGGFTTDGEVALNHIARWDGEHWGPLAGGLPEAVNALAVLDEPSGPTLYAGGAFALGGLGGSRVARWDGASWHPLVPLSRSVFTLAVFDDGSGGGPSLYAGGQFTDSLTRPLYRVAKWDGSDWKGLQSGISSNGTSVAVYAMTTFDDGTGPALYVGGQFELAGGAPAESIARWDGSAWSALGSGVSDGGFQGYVDALTVFDDGTGPALYAAGKFTVAGGVPANRVARWDGASWSALGDGLNSNVYALSVFDDGSGPALYAGGEFTTAGGGAAGLIAKWDGASWSPLGSGLGTGVFPAVRALTVFDDPESAPALFVGGSFLAAFDSHDSRIARWQGCLDTAAPVLSLPASVVALDSWIGPPGEIVTFVVTASDDLDPSPMVVCTPPSGSFFAPGTTIVHCTATDDAGNQSTGDFPVIVQAKTRGRAR